MIKNHVPKPFIKANPLPNYVGNIKKYVLVGTIASGYVITLAKLNVGESISNGVILSHARFQSFSNYGKRKSDVKTRFGGYNREINAVKNAMFEAGVEFNNGSFESKLELIKALREWFKLHNPDIIKCDIVS